MTSTMMPERTADPPAAVGAQVELAAIYGEHFAFVHRNLQRWGLSASEAEDAAQEVFLVVHRRLSELRPGASIRAWLFGIVRRVAADRRRGARRAERRLRLLPEPEAAADQLALVAQRELVDCVAAFVAELDDDSRAIFLMGEVEGMPAFDVARALGKSRVAVYSRQRRLRAALGEHLRRAGFAEPAERAP